MKTTQRTLDEWHEVLAVLQACEFHRNVFLSQEAELKRLMPELDEKTVSDIANGLITLDEMEVKESEVA